MSLGILFVDELLGFYKSKLMAILWIGMPLLSFVVHYLGGSESAGIPMSYLTALLVSSVSGTLGSVSLSTSITNEKNRRVYDLFLIRPVKRWEILVSKYVAVYACLILAVALSVFVGVIIDGFTLGSIPGMLVTKTVESLGTCLAGTALACAIGTFFGVLMSSVPAAAILSVYLGNQITSISMIPSLIPGLLPGGINPLLISIPFGTVLAAVFMAIALIRFNKMQF
jgi:ABC-2 type transport system permease protein